MSTINTMTYRARIEYHLQMPYTNHPHLKIEESAMMDELVSEPTDDSPSVLEETLWSNLTVQQFFAGYSKADSIYDETWAIKEP